MVNVVKSVRVDVPQQTIVLLMEDSNGAQTELTIDGKIADDIAVAMSIAAGALNAKPGTFSAQVVTEYSLGVTPDHKFVLALTIGGGARIPFDIPMALIPGIISAFESGMRRAKGEVN